MMEQDEHGNTGGLKNNNGLYWYESNTHTHELPSHNHAWWSPQVSAGSYNISGINSDQYVCVSNNGWRSELIIDNKKLAEAVEDMAFTLKTIIEKYDLKEVKPILRNESIQKWADSGKDRILRGFKEEEKEKHLDEKLFEI